MEDNISTKRFLELAVKSERSGRYTYTDFLSLADISELNSISKEIRPTEFELWGGHEQCERKVARFGSEEALGYSEPFPVVCIKISPLSAKFADKLTHRDFLGALMSLGVERSVLGDIFVEENCAYIFCLERMADYIISELTSVKHTAVKCERSGNPAEYAPAEPEPVTVQTASMRADAVVAKACNLSRADSLALFAQQKVFINGRLCTGNSTLLKAGDSVTVRGFGKFDVLEEMGLSRKGKLNIKIARYGK